MRDEMADPHYMATCANTETHSMKKPPQPPTPDSLLIRFDEVRALIQVSRRTMYRIIDDVRMDFPQPFTLRGMHRWNRQAVEKWLSSKHSHAQRERRKLIRPSPRKASPAIQQPTSEEAST